MREAVVAAFLVSNLGFRGLKWSESQGFLVANRYDGCRVPVAKTSRAFPTLYTNACPKRPSQLDLRKLNICVMRYAFTSNFQPTFGSLSNIRKRFCQRFPFRDASSQSGNLRPESALFS